jgi:monoamine oxidase
MRSVFARLQRRFGARVSGSNRQLEVRSHIINLKRRFPIEQWLATSETTPKVLRPTVIVVGGGLAGLMAGFVLAHDFKVIVLEARKRIGGRVHS